MKLNSKNVQLIFETSQFHAKWTINYTNFIRSTNRQKKNLSAGKFSGKNHIVRLEKKYLLALAHEQWIGIRQYHTRHFCLQTIGYSMNVSVLRLAGPIVIASETRLSTGKKSSVYIFDILSRFFCEFFFAYTEILIELFY